MHMNIDRTELLVSMIAEETLRTQQALALKAYCFALEIVSARKGDDAADRTVSLGQMVDALGAANPEALYVADKLNLLMMSPDGKRFLVPPVDTLSLVQLGVPPAVMTAPGGSSVRH